jgi:alpha-beta hydrolase superfamily lysophospholipase
MNQYIRDLPLDDMNRGQQLLQNFFTIAASSVLDIKACLTIFVFFCLAFAQPANAFVMRLDKNSLASEIGTPIYVWRDMSMVPRMAIIALQGAVLHGRAYDAIGYQLAARGALVVAPDFRGFGAFYRGSDGYMPNKTVDLKQSEADLRALYDKIHQSYPFMPIFWMGESFGANACVRMSAQKGGGLILSSYAPKQRLFFDPLMLGQSLMWFTNPHRYMNISGHLNSRLSENPQIVQELADDPYNRYAFRAGDLLNMARFTSGGNELAKNLDPETPVLIIHGTKDKLIRTSDVEKFYDNLQCKDKKLIVLKDIGHIHIETSHLDPKLVDTIANWALTRSNQARLVESAYQPNFAQQ